MFDLARLSQGVDGHWTPDKIDLIRDQIAAKASYGELALFLDVAHKKGLDPLSREIYAVFRFDRQSGREKMSIQVGIDGYRILADATGTYCGNDDPIYDGTDADHPLWARVTIWRMVLDQRVAFTATARWAEYVQTKKGGSPTRMWEKMPYLMLAKCAESLAFRKAFPAALSGLLTNEEMGQADNDVITVQAKVVESRPASNGKAQAKPEPKPKPGPTQQNAARVASGMKPKPPEQPPQSERHQEALQACRKACNALRDLVGESSPTRITELRKEIERASYDGPKALNELTAKVESELNKVADVKATTSSYSVPE